MSAVLVNTVTGLVATIISGTAVWLWQRGSSSDVHALLGIASLADELGCAISVQSSNELREGVGDQAEFCIGGPDSNTRTVTHLTSFLSGVMFKPYNIGSRVR